MTWTFLLMAVALVGLARVANEDDPDWINEVVGDGDDLDDDELDADDDELDADAAAESDGGDEASDGDGEDDGDADQPAGDGDGDDDQDDDAATDATGGEDDDAAGDQQSADDDAIPEDDLLTKQRELAEKHARDAQQAGEQGDDAMVGLDDAEAKELKDLRGKLADDDDYLSVREHKRITELESKRSQAAEAAQSEQQQLTQVQASIEAAYDVMSAEKMGEGLDFGTVHEQGFENLSAKDQREILAAGPKAARVMYERMIARTPELRERQAQAKAKTTGETKAGKATKSGKSRGRPGKRVTAKRGGVKDQSDGRQSADDDALDAEDLDALDVEMGNIDGLTNRLMG